ncbi:MAG: CBS domain-containing protein [Balneolaceae bacterium]|nr:CBS domain-containing protein [Balneolaceae bacterium]
MLIADILKEKGHQVYSISPDSTVYESIEKMSEKNVGALLVMEGEKLVGIISERDYSTKIILKGRTSKETKVHEIMTSDVHCVTPKDNVETCMSMMTNEKFRHLPVLDQDENVVGVISIGDLVKAIISQQKGEISTLRNYITSGGGYPG